MRLRGGVVEFEVCAATPVGPARLPSAATPAVAKKRRRATKRSLAGDKARLFMARSGKNIGRCRECGIATRLTLVSRRLWEQQGSPRNDRGRGRDDSGSVIARHRGGNRCWGI